MVRELGWCVGEEVQGCSLGDCLGRVKGWEEGKKPFATLNTSTPTSFLTEAREDAALSAEFNGIFPSVFSTKHQFASIKNMESGIIRPFEGLPKLMLLAPQECCC